ncbi:hypothetical protein cypCar_00040366, partial [Cyprinus carpio]
LHTSNENILSTPEIKARRFDVSGKDKPAVKPDKPSKDAKEKEQTGGGKAPSGSVMPPPAANRQHCTQVRTDADADEGAAGDPGSATASIRVELCGR